MADDDSSSSHKCSKCNCCKWFCVISFIVSAITFVVAVALSWSFAVVVPHVSSIFPYAGAGAATLPILFAVLGVGITLVSRCKIIRVGKWRFRITKCIRLIVLFTGGLCSVIGGILIFVAAANPPPEEDYNRNSYIAFAAFAGIFAVITCCACCCGTCCLPSKVWDEGITEYTAKDDSCSRECDEVEASPIDDNCSRNVSSTDGGRDLV